MFVEDYAYYAISTEEENLRSLRDWLRARDPTTEYDYANASKCLVAQWSGLVLDMVKPMFGERLGHCVLACPWTFGAALARVETALAEVGRV